MPELPTLLNGGVIVAIALLVILLMGWKMTRPPQWRCSVCGAMFPDFVLLVQHEEQHERGHCLCRGAIHHPACPKAVR